eukprot:1665848-Amphidinium_carterae.1
MSQQRGPTPRGGLSPWVPLRRWSRLPCPLHVSIYLPVPSLIVIIPASAWQQAPHEQPGPETLRFRISFA